MCKNITAPIENTILKFDFCVFSASHVMTSGKRIILVMNNRSVNLL